MVCLSYVYGTATCIALTSCYCKIVHYFGLYYTKGTNFNGCSDPQHWAGIQQRCLRQGHADLTHEQHDQAFLIYVKAF